MPRGNRCPWLPRECLAAAHPLQGPNNDNLGWITYSLSPGAVGHTPKAATIRLEYSAGAWTKGSRIEPDYRGVMGLHGGATLSGIGQNAAGKAFVSVAKDMGRSGNATEFHGDHQRRSGIGQPKQYAGWSHGRSGPNGAI